MVNCKNDTLGQVTLEAMEISLTCTEGFLSSQPNGGEKSWCDQHQLKMSTGVSKGSQKSG